MDGPPTLGQELGGELLACLRRIHNGLVLGDRERPVISGVAPGGTFVGGQTADGALARVVEILRESGRIYSYGNTICLEVPDADDPHLVTLAVGPRAEPHAHHVLANPFLCAVGEGDRVVQSLPPPSFVGSLLADEALRGRLDRVRYYSRRPA